MAVLGSLLVAIVILIAVFVGVAVFYALVRKISPRKAPPSVWIANPYEAMNQIYRSKEVRARQDHFSGWKSVERVKVGTRAGFIGVTDDGDKVKLVTWMTIPPNLINIKERLLSGPQLLSVSSMQDDLSKVVTHKEKTPIAVSRPRSAGTRALVGGVVAGPIGAMVGGFSGSGAGSKIKLVQTERNETVYYKSHPRLVLEIDDIESPRLTLEFETLAQTELWSSRLQAVINRARS